MNGLFKKKFKKIFDLWVLPNRTLITDLGAYYDVLVYGINHEKYSTYMTRPVSFASPATVSTPRRSTCTMYVTVSRSNVCKTRELRLACGYCVNIILFSDTPRDVNVWPCAARARAYDNNDVGLNTNAPSACGPDDRIPNRRKCTAPPIGPVIGPRRSVRFHYRAFPTAAELEEPTSLSVSSRFSDT